jgi:hypothetical protein
MPASSTAYGSTSPGAIDPFPIESVLAKIVGENNPANAQNMLNTYQIQNQTSQGNYNYAQQQQHDFAREQLHQQLQENYMKNAIEAAKVPGALTLLGGLSGGAALGGVNISPLETNLRQAQAAKTAQEGGAATWSLTNAGFQPNEDMAKAFTAGLAGPKGPPLPLQIAQLRESGRNSRAGSDALKLNAQLAPDPNHPELILSGKIPPNMTIDQYITSLRDKKGYSGSRPPVRLPGSGGGVANSDSDGGGDSEAPPATPSVAPTPAPAPKSVTNLPPKAAPQAQQRVQQAAPGGGQAQRAANAFAENTVRLRSPEAYADMMAGATNGNVLLITGPDGTLHIKGKSGRLY